jgi:hypothetical protein
MHPFVTYLEISEYLNLIDGQKVRAEIQALVRRTQDPHSIEILLANAGSSWIQVRMQEIAYVTHIGFVSLPDHNQSVATFALARLGFGDYRALDFLRTKMQDGRAQNSPLASYVEPHSHRGTASGSISVDPSSHTGRAYGLDVQIPPY